MLRQFLPLGTNKVRQHGDSGGLQDCGEYYLSGPVFVYGVSNIQYGRLRTTTKTSKNDNLDFRALSLVFTALLTAILVLT
jgi:hypothetical protein